MPGPIYGIPTLDQVPAPVANVSFASYRGTNLADPTGAQDISSKAYVDAQIAAISNQGAGFTGVITGCGVVWTGLLNFTVAAGSYSINGTTYTIAQTNLTLSAADPTNPRFDVIAVNTSSAAVVITGTPAASPLIPTVDPATQLYLTAVSILANATTPGNVSNTLMYAENAGSPTEWNSSSSGTTWNLASTNNPHLGTKDIEATSLSAAAYAQLQIGSGTFDLSTVNNLVFYIRSKAAWNSNRSLTIEFLNSGTLVGNALTFREGSFGFVSSNTTSYQQIVIPTASFNVGSTALNQIRFIAAGSGGSAIGFYLDDVSLQSGVSITSQNFLAWRQTWSSTTAYVKNDLVTYLGRAWVGLLPNVNSAPTDTNTNWQALDGPVIPELRVLTTSNTIPANSSVVYVDSVQVNAGSSLTIPSTSAILATAPSSSQTTPRTIWDAVVQVTGSDFTTNSLSMVDITGLVYPLIPNSKYEIQVDLSGSANGTNGVKPTLTFSSAGATGAVNMLGTTNGGATATAASIGATPATVLWNFSNSTCPIFMKGIVVTGSNAGNLSVQILNGGAQTVTIQTGSVMKIKKLT